MFCNFKRGVKTSEACGVRSATHLALIGYTHTHKLSHYLAVKGGFLPFSLSYFFTLPQALPFYNRIK